MVSVEHVDTNAISLSVRQDQDKIETGISVRLSHHRPQNEGGRSISRLIKPRCTLLAWRRFVIGGSSILSRPMQQIPDTTGFNFRSGRIGRDGFSCRMTFARIPNKSCQFAQFQPPPPDGGARRTALSFGTATREIGRHFQAPSSSLALTAVLQGQRRKRAPEIGVPICYDFERGIICQILHQMHRAPLPILLRDTSLNFLPERFRVEGFCQLI